MAQDSYFKRASDKVASITKAVGDKAREIGESLTKSGSGNDGIMGAAKGKISGRQKQVDDAVDAATEVRANGGLIGSRSHGGYSKR